MKKIFLFIALIFGASLITACSIFQKKQVNQNSDHSGNFDKTITEKYWKLTELNGQPVSGDFNKEPHFILKKEDNRVTGNGSCNGFGGSYTLDEEKGRISFSNLFSTRMACPDMSVEQAFMDVLSKVDNYSLHGDTLTLNKARMAPLAKFEAVYFN
ncbi:META domain-containing protein [Albibacterium indicum]|uniref:META domain-containing protein n=1 Tax=Albibacterium indicum TaxID=2292082 RepID=UPI000E51B87F|nr:META domain-containing protein [Pedobacter indicus]